MSKFIWVCICNRYSFLLGNWEHWKNRVQEYKYPSDSKPEYASILVPNVDNVRTDFLIDTIAKQQKVNIWAYAGTWFIFYCLQYLK